MKMSSARSLATFSAILACSAFAPALGGISQVSILINSQQISRPSIDNVWSASGSTLSAAKGIGIIVKPTWVSANDTSDFALHHNSAFGPPKYQTAYVPNAAAATVTYIFDRPTIVSSVLIVQHPNGVTRIAGAVNGNPIGSAFGPSGDVTGQFVVATDGEQQIFNLNNTAAGTTFKLTVLKTSNASAFAIHRAFLLDEHGQRIPLAPPAKVGGSVTGVSGEKLVSCLNLTTGRQVYFLITSNSWECEAHGLIVQPGHVIEQRVRPN